MRMILPLPPVAMVAGQLLAPAFACGLNLYATVALLGIASRLGWGDALPIGLRGLEHPLVIGSALLLYAVEFVVDKIRFLDSAWDALHTLIRPAAAGLLVGLALEGMPLDSRIVAAALAGTAALAAHGLKAGLRIRLNEHPARLWPITVSASEDVLAATLALLALTRPEAAAGMAFGLLLLILLLGPRLIRPATLGLHLLAGRLRGFFGARRWRTRDELPARLRGLIAQPQLGAAPPRATRAALLRAAKGTRHYRSGWLVLSDEGPVFLYRSLLRSRRLRLPQRCAATLRRGLLADALELASEHERYLLLLLKDGPDPAQTVAELSARGQAPKFSG